MVAESWKKRKKILQASKIFQRKFEKNFRIWNSNKNELKNLETKYQQMGVKNLRAIDMEVKHNQRQLLSNHLIHIQIIHGTQCKVPCFSHFDLTKPPH